MSFHQFSCYASRLSSGAVSPSVASCDLTPCHTSWYVISYHGKGWKYCDPRTLRDQYSEDAAKQEEWPSDSSVQRKICVSAPSMFLC